MQLPYVDLVFAVIVILLVVQGWHRGFVRMAGSLLALLVSVVIATWGVMWLEDVTGWRLSAQPVTLVIVFLTLTLILSRVAALVISLLDLIRKVLSIIPGIGLINSLLGAVIGFLQAGLLAIGVSFVAINFLPEGNLKSLLLDSEVINYTAASLNSFGLIK